MDIVFNGVGDSDRLRDQTVSGLYTRWLFCASCLSVDLLLCLFYVFSLLILFFSLVVYSLSFGFDVRSRLAGQA